MQSNSQDFHQIQKLLYNIYLIIYFVKFALRGLAETIAMEVSNTKISVTLALPADTDTPGYATENMSKPEETKIISATAGLAKPEDISKKILRDSLV